jgi:hypothetical protein
MEQLLPNNHRGASQLVGASADSFFSGEGCLQFRSHFRRAVSNRVALLRWNLFSYRNLREWLNRPLETPQPAPDQLALDLDSIRTSGGPTDLGKREMQPNSPNKTGAFTVQEILFWTAVAGQAESAGHG